MRVISSSGPLHLLLKVGWKVDFQPTRQRSFPGHMLPLPVPFAVFAGLYKRPLNLNFSPQQMLPLIPGAVPEYVEDSWIEPELKLAAHVAAQGTVVVEITSTQRYMKPPTPEFG